ncbi:MAG: putative iron-regulated protein [Phenylobacterium sp.]|jgi:putative iron-regulated protein
MKLTKNIITASLLSIALTGCGGGSSSNSSAPAPTTPPVVVDNGEFTFDATNMIDNLTNNVIVAGYQSLNDKAQAFHASTVTLLNAPTADALEAAKQAWQDVRVPWEQGEAHIFGPVDALSIDPHLDTWPLNTSDLQALLATGANFNATDLASWNDDVQGFHTMEFLLFGDGIADNHNPIDDVTALEVEYLVAAAEVFQNHTQSLYDAWVVRRDANDVNSPAYKDLLLTPDNDVYASSLGVVEELINGMIGIVDEVGNGKIAEPFGSSIQDSDTSLVESQYSWNSLADFTNNIKGVQLVYRGELAGDADQAGIIDFVTAADATVASRIDTQISAAIAAIAAIAGGVEAGVEDSANMPFRQAISDPDARVRIQTAIEALTLLQASLENDVLTLLTKWQA